MQDLENGSHGPRRAAFEWAQAVVDGVMDADTSARHLGIGEGSAALGLEVVDASNPYRLEAGVVGVKEAAAAETAEDAATPSACSDPLHPAPAPVRATRPVRGGAGRRGNLLSNKEAAARLVLRLYPDACSGWRAA